MSSFNLANKLKPSKKAWKSLTIHLKSIKTLSNFNISKTFKTTKKQLVSALHIIRSLVPRKIFDLTRSSRRRCRYHLSHPHRCQPPPLKSFKTVYIDELYFSSNNLVEQPKIVGKETHDVASSSSCPSLTKAHGDNKLAKKEQVHSTSNKPMVYHDDDGLKMSLLLSKFRGIDERAEEFISKFKEDMKLEKERSIIDYQEMLAQSVK